VTEAFWDIAGRHIEETVAIVSHGGPIALLCQMVLGLPYKRPMPFAIDNCSISTVLARQEDTVTAPKTVLLGLNDVCHLREAEVHA
jgi:broad specificity phosphatase PhoE